MNRKYQGIALFGMPGAGKSTITRGIEEKTAISAVLEASTIFRTLPEENLLPLTMTGLIDHIQTHTPDRSISRQHIARIHEQLIVRFHPCIIADLMNNLTQAALQKNPRTVVVVSGIRGYERAEYLKSRGFFMVYIDCNQDTAAHRLACRDHRTINVTRAEIKQEEKQYHTARIKKIAHLILDGSLETTKNVDLILAYFREQECEKCLNTTLNPTIVMSSDGLCQMCKGYELRFDPSALATELAWVKQQATKIGHPYNALVGISGGKDSTVLLHNMHDLGFTPLAFTFSTGYYPSSIMSRSRTVANLLTCPHEIIDIRKYFTDSDRISFKKTLELHQKHPSPRVALEYREAYLKNRLHYSLRENVSMPYVRSCILCRRATIRAYYDLALHKGTPLIALGINEWTHLSTDGSTQRYSGIRKIQPHIELPPIYIVHLPFLLRQTADDKRAILEKIGWEQPRGEQFIETNDNSCLFARATNIHAAQLLGFHPDTTRLSREITAGFISKDEARAALTRYHRHIPPLKNILKNAHLI